MHLHGLVKVDAFAWICYRACMNERPSETAVLAWARLIRGARLTLASVEGELKDAGFPPLEWYDVLLELSRSDGPLRPVALEGRLLLPQHNISRLLERLAQAGHIERMRCEKDGRGYYVAITASGRDLLKRMWPVYAAAIQRHLGRHVTEPEAEALAGLLGRLSAGEHEPAGGCSAAGVETAL